MKFYINFLLEVKEVVYIVFFYFSLRPFWYLIFSEFVVDCVVGVVSHLEWP